MTFARDAQGALADPQALIDSLRPWRIVPDRLRHWARERPDDRFVQCESPWLSFAEVDRRTDRIAAGLHALGVSKGDCVAVILPNRIEMVLTMLALAKLGAILVPLNTFLKGDFLAYQLIDSTARLAVTDAAGAREVARLRDRMPQLATMVTLGVAEGERMPPPAPPPADVRIVDFVDVEANDAACPTVALTMRDPISILYTSGTTGMPKGCVLSHGYYMAMPWADIGADMLRPDDVIYSAMPLFHAAAGVGHLAKALLLGLPVCFDAAFSATGFIARAREIGATVTTLVAAMGNAVLARPEAPDDRDHRLRSVMLNALTGAQQEAFERRFGAKGHQLGYGQTEGMGFTKAHIDCRLTKRTTIGHAGPGFEIALLDELDRRVGPGEVGEIAVRSLEPELMFQRYWRKPDATVEAFRSLWYHTGDYGSVDADGFYSFRGRKTDSMRRRGENVSAMEVEHAIAHHPAIAAVAVHGVPSPLGEDDIKACIVLKPDAALSPADLFDHLRTNLPYFAVPRYVEFLDALPLTASGRVRKPALKERDMAGTIDLEALGLTIEREARRA